jgi:hypothetical protein
MARKRRGFVVRPLRCLVAKVFNFEQPSREQRTYTCGQAAIRAEERCHGFYGANDVQGLTSEMMFLNSERSD